MSLLQQLARHFFPRMTLKQVSTQPVATVLVAPDVEGVLRPLTVSNGQLVFWQAPAPLPGYEPAPVPRLELGETAQFNAQKTTTTTYTFTIPEGMPQLNLEVQGILP